MINYPDGTVTCPKCKGHGKKASVHGMRNCGGTGRVPSDADAAH